MVDRIATWGRRIASEDYALRTAAYPVIIAYSNAELGVSSSSWGYKPSLGLPESRSTEQRIADVYQAGDIIDENNLARRPRDWRADYVPRRSIIATLKGLSLKRPKDHPLLAYDYDGQKRKLNTQLLYNPTRPPFYWDMRTQPIQLQSDSVFSISKMQQSAFQPPAMKARIIHPRLPWYIDVVPIQKLERHITVGDVFMYMYMQLHEPIRMRHYWNEELGERERRLVAKAFGKRCDGDVLKVSQGVVQVDFLGTQVVLEGLWGGDGGIWIMKTRKM